MYKLLEYFSSYSENTIRYPKHFPDDFDYLISRLALKFNGASEGSYNLDIRVQRPNIFTSLLNDIELILTDDVFEIYDSILNDGIYFVNNYYFTSTKNKGKPLKNIILHNIDEFFLLEEDTGVNLLDFEDTWRTYESIKVIASDNTELVFKHLYKTELEFTSYIIYKVDIVALTLQYYYWIKEEKEKSVEADLDSALFLNRIPFNNLIKSFNINALTNLFLTFNNKSDLNVIYSRVSGSVTNINKYILSVAKDWKKILHKQRYRSYFDFTKRFYPYTKPLYDLNKFITIINNQNEWLYFLAELTKLSYYIDFVKNDNEFISKLKITLKEFKRKNIRLDEISNFYLNNLIMTIEEKIR